MGVLIPTTPDGALQGLLKRLYLMLEGYIGRQEKGRFISFPHPRTNFHVFGHTDLCVHFKAQNLFSQDTLAGSSSSFHPDAQVSLIYSSELTEVLHPYPVPCN